MAACSTGVPARRTVVMMISCKLRRPRRYACVSVPRWTASRMIVRSTWNAARVSSTIGMIHLSLVDKAGVPVVEKAHRCGDGDDEPKARRPLLRSAPAEAWEGLVVVDVVVATAQERLKVDVRR